MKQSLGNTTVLAVLVGVALILGLVALFLPSSKISFGGVSNFDEVDTTEGYRVDNTSRISGSGSSTPTSLVLGANGTELLSYFSATATWNPGAISSSTAASTTVTVARVALGDICFASLDSSTATEGVSISAFAQAASTTVVTLGFIHPLSLSVDFATGTLRVGCWRH